MEYNLKEKIEITPAFIEDLISKSWQEVESVQQQIANVNTSTKLGNEVAKLLKNMCTNHYVLIGCLEALMDEPADVEANTDSSAMIADKQTAIEATVDEVQELMTDIANEPIEADPNFEPFEYFVDFDEPTGDPLSDEDLYG